MGGTVLPVRANFTGNQCGARHLRTDGRCAAGLRATRGEWHCYELMVQANTPGRLDGRIAFWFDRRLAGDFPNLQFKAVETLKLNRAYIAMYESRENDVRR